MYTVVVQIERNPRKGRPCGLPLVRKLALQIKFNLHGKYTFGRLTAMTKWFDRASTFLLVIFGLLYVGAKIHFFTRYWPLSLGAYLEEHWPF
jgi:hypothetical protein